jgi:hypothetical protein
MRFANQNQMISDSLAQVEKEKAMNSQNIYQNLLTKGYEILNSDRASATSWANNEWGMTQAQISNMMDLTNMNVDNWNKSADRNISSTLDLSKMSVADIYNEQQRADAAAARAAASRASRSYSRQGSPGYNGTPAKTVLTPAKTGYDTTVAKQQQTPVGRYVNTVAPVERWRQTLSPTVGRAVANNSHSIANTPKLSPWDKMKALGL